MKICNYRIILIVIVLFKLNICLGPAVEKSQPGKNQSPSSLKSSSSLNIQSKEIAPVKSATSNILGSIKDLFSRKNSLSSDSSKKAVALGNSEAQSLKLSSKKEQIPNSKITELEGKVKSEISLNSNEKLTTSSLSNTNETAAKLNLALIDKLSKQINDLDAQMSQDSISANDYNSLSKQRDSIYQQYESKLNNLKNFKTEEFNNISKDTQDRISKYIDSYKESISKDSILKQLENVENLNTEIAKIYDKYSNLDQNDPKYKTLSDEHLKLYEEYKKQVESLKEIVDTNNGLNLSDIQKRLDVFLEDKNLQSNEIQSPNVEKQSVTEKTTALEVKPNTVNQNSSKSTITTPKPNIAPKPTITTSKPNIAPKPTITTPKPNIASKIKSTSKEDTQNNKLSSTVTSTPEKNVTSGKSSIDLAQKPPIKELSKDLLTDSSTDSDVNSVSDNLNKLPSSPKIKIPKPPSTPSVESKIPPAPSLPSFLEGKVKPTEVSSSKPNEQTIISASEQPLVNAAPSVSTTNLSPLSESSFSPTRNFIQESSNNKLPIPRTPKVVRKPNSDNQGTNFDQPPSFDKSALWIQIKESRNLRQVDKSEVNTYANSLKDKNNNNDIASKILERRVKVEGND